MRLKLTPEELKQWILSVDDYLLEEFLNNGLEDLIEELEEDDFFGTEGFNKRYA